MNKFLALIAGVALILCACDNNKVEEETQNSVTQQSAVEVDTSATGWWKDIAGEPENFHQAFDKLSETQKFYFCVAFSMGALSETKPATASAMVSYFFGLGLARYGQGVDEANYQAFDFGKNVFRYELVVNDILEQKTCENIMIEATEYAKDKGVTSEQLNDDGRPEVEKMVEFIK